MYVKQERIVTKQLSCKGEKVLKRLTSKRVILTNILLVSLMLANVSYAKKPCEIDASTIEIKLPQPEELMPSEEENTPKDETSKEVPKVSEEELKATFQAILEDMLSKRYDAILSGDTEALKSMYNTSIKTGLYAYENEAIKTKYLKNWADKQGVKFTDIDQEIHMRKVRDRENGLYGMTCNVATSFTYVYDNMKDTPNTFKLGTSHYIHLQKQDDGTYKVVKEWYTDPFADSLDLDELKSTELKTYMSEHTAPAYTPDERTQKAIDYAHQYCGIGEEENLFKYNDKYLNCNPRGGDCANFASQILHEGGGFKKNDTWNYTNDGTKAWVNAQAFKNYMVHSGRASYVARGSYKEVYKDAFALRPGDFVAYEKKGRITHISTVTGLDSHGYPLVTCHNTDRLLVPYDLGWSNKNITFHLVDMHY